MAPVRRSRDPGDGAPASGGVGPRRRSGRRLVGRLGRRAARADRAGDGSSCLATRGGARDCSGRQPA